MTDPVFAVVGDPRTAEMKACDEEVEAESGARESLVERLRTEVVAIIDLYELARAAAGLPKEECVACAVRAHLRRCALAVSA